MGIESNSQNRWQTSRERNRLKARFQVHSRIIASVSQSTDDGPSSSYNGIEDDETTLLHQFNTALKYLQAIIKNDLSSFSIAALSRDAGVVNRPLPSVDEAPNGYEEVEVDLTNGIQPSGYEYLAHAQKALSLMLSAQPSTQQVQPYTLAISKFGPAFISERLMPYFEYVLKSGSITLLEYASLTGRHGIVSQLLLGGVDPTVTGLNCYSFKDESDEEEREHKSKARCQVLRLLHSLHDLHSEDDRPPVIPLSIWSYIVRSVIEMRINGVLESIKDNSVESTDDKSCRVKRHCQLCENKQTTLLRAFGPPCHHTFCESCLWIHTVQHVPNCMDLCCNVVTCPICHVEFQEFQYCKSTNMNCRGDTEDVSIPWSPLDSIVHEGKSNEELTTTIYKQRCADSLAKFMQLPKTSAELKLVTRKQLNDTSKKNNAQSIVRRKKIRDPISSTWHQALYPRISNHLSQDVRIDRFFQSVISSPQVVMCYLQLGIDVNGTNEYGQTPLYVACWRGSALIVQCLLEYGADVGIVANGGSTCWSVARRLGRYEILRVLKRYSVESSCVSEFDFFTNDSLIREQELHNSHHPNVSFLIDPTEDHPGAGACIIDNALSEQDLQQLERLLKSLPVVACDGTDDVSTTSSDDKSQFRPSRSYFCDTEQIIQDMLQNCVDAARNALDMQSTETKKCESHDEHKDAVKDKLAVVPTSVFHHLRFLHYNQKGGLLPPHVDLCRVDDLSGHRSTHTFILYLTDCQVGGGTALLQHLNDPKVLAVAQPKRGRALIFPHLCPHSGIEVECVPKVLLRGEVILL